MNKSNKMPLLWRVLSNKYGNDLVFVNCRDRKGKESVALGFEAGPQWQGKVLVYGREDKEPVLYEGLSVIVDCGDMTLIVLSGIMKLAALSEFFDRVIDGSIDISRANLMAKEEVLKVPETERKDLEDETRIGEAGYAGFNPHENLDMEELMRRGIKNPHAASHPGAANPHAANPHAANPHAGGNAGDKAASETVTRKSTTTSSSSEGKSESPEPSSSVAEPSPSTSSSSVEKPSSSITESSAFKDESSAKPTTTLAEEDTSVDAAKGTEHATAHTKDEL
jgi:protein disulfide-isomerase A6